MWSAKCLQCFTKTLLLCSIKFDLLYVMLMTQVEKNKPKNTIEHKMVCFLLQQVHYSCTLLNVLYNFLWLVGFIDSVSNNWNLMVTPTSTHNSLRSKAIDRGGSRQLRNSYLLGRVRAEEKNWKPRGIGNTMNTSR